MINFLFCTVLPPRASKVDQTHKFDDFLDLTVLSDLIRQILTFHNTLIQIIGCRLACFNVLGEGRST